MALKGKTLSELLTNIRDYAKPNRFSVTFNVNVPRAIQGDIDVGHFLIKGMTLPTFGAAPINIEHLGRRIQIPGDAVYGDFNATFRVDADYKIYNGMHSWSKAVLDQEGEITQATIADAMGSTAIIEVYDHKLKPMRKVTIHNVFPTVVGELAYDMDTVDTPLEYIVTFAYSHFVQG
jgi:hypothetical protein